MKNQSLVFVAVAALLLPSSCGEKQGGDKKDSPAVADRPVFNAEVLLPQNTPSLAIDRTDSVLVLSDSVSDSALGSDAQRYRKFRFLGLARCAYTARGYPMTVEIAQFPTPEDAYGFYADGRPLAIATTELGAEGFLEGATTSFVKGPYCAHVVAVENTPDEYAAQSILTHQIEEAISAVPQVPFFYTMFPYKYRIAASGRYHPEAFLRVQGLDQVYLTHYSISEDTVVLFLTMDENGIKFIALDEFAESLGEVRTAPEEVPYIEGYSLRFVHPEVGEIVAGLVRGKLVGMLGHGGGEREWLLATWIKGLQ